MKKFTSLLALLLSITALFAQNNYSFQVERSGDGIQPVILIPGYTCDGEVWASTLEALNPNFDCHTLTMPGFAGHKPEDSPSLENWVKEVGSYIQKEKLDKATIIGHSLGGMMAQWLAADFPDLIKNIIVVDALPALAALNNSTFEENKTPDCSQMTAMFKGMDNDQFEQNQKMSLAMMTTDKTKYDLLLKWSIDSDRNTLGAIYCQLMNTDLRDKIAAVQCPSLILLESNFKMMDTVIQKQYDKLQKAKLVYANQGMHFIMYDDPEWYLDQVNDFLK